jgi:hypothetical protein
MQTDRNSSTLAEKINASTSIESKNSGMNVGWGKGNKNKMGVAKKGCYEYCYLLLF